MPELSVKCLASSQYEVTHAAAVKVCFLNIFFELCNRHVNTRLATDPTRFSALARLHYVVCFFHMGLA